MDKRTGVWLSGHTPVRFMCREPNPGREIPSLPSLRRNSLCGSSEGSEMI